MRRVYEFTNVEIKIFNYFQNQFKQLNFLTHFNRNFRLWVDLNSSQKIKINVMIYHLKENFDVFVEQTTFKFVIKFILFFNHFFTNVETKYWSTKLKIVDLIWIIKRVHHLMQFVNRSTIVIIDHVVAIDISTQITLTSTNTNKLNFRLIRTS